MSRYPASPVKEMRKTAASTPQTRKLRICRKGTEAASGQSACKSAYVLQFNSIWGGGGSIVQNSRSTAEERNECGRIRTNTVELQRNPCPLDYWLANKNTC